jgi:MFS superfamily sulfate permease-like transporter
MAVIAAILMYTAINMVEKEHFIRFFRLDRTDFAISLLVAGITLFADPIIGIMTGAALSLLVFAHKHSQGQFAVSVSQNAAITTFESVPEEQEAAKGLLVYSFKGGLSYLNARTHLSRFEQGLEGYETIVLRFREVSFIDIDGIEVVEEIIHICKGRGQKVAITSVPNAIRQTLLEHAHSFQKMYDQQLVFEKTADAVHTISKR